MKSIAVLLVCSSLMKNTSSFSFSEEIGTQCDTHVVHFLSKLDADIGSVNSRQLQNKHPNKPKLQPGIQRWFKAEAEAESLALGVGVVYRSTSPRVFCCSREQEYH